MSMCTHECACEFVKKQQQCLPENTGSWKTVPHLAGLRLALVGLGQTTQVFLNLHLHYKVDTAAPASVAVSWSIVP